MAKLDIDNVTAAPRTMNPKDADMSAIQLQPGEAVPVTAASAESPIYGFEMLDLEMMFPHGNPPVPPKCIQERLKRNDQEWRWLSKPMVKYHGMRMHVTVSPTAEERDKINNGGDSPPGVHVDVENKICWQDDAWLGSIPKRLAELRRQHKIALSAQQSKIAKDQGLALKEEARRAGVKLVQHDVQQWTQQGE